MGPSPKAQSNFLLLPSAEVDDSGPKEMNLGYMCSSLDMVCSAGGQVVARTRAEPAAAASTLVEAKMAAAVVAAAFVEEEHFVGEEGFCTTAVENRLAVGALFADIALAVERTLDRLAVDKSVAVDHLCLDYSDNSLQLDLLLVTSAFGLVDMWTDLVAPFVEVKQLVEDVRGEYLVDMRHLAE